MLLAKIFQSIAFAGKFYMFNTFDFLIPIKVHDLRAAESVRETATMKFVEEE